MPIPCDFIGDMHRLGAWHFLRQDVTLPRSAHAVENPKIVKPHQREFLQAQARTGAIAGRLVEHAGEVWWLDGSFFELSHGGF